MTTRRHWGSVAIVAAATAFVVSCENRSGPAPSNPTPVPTSPAPSALSVSTKCFGPFRPGSYYGLACVAAVSETTPPPLYTYGVHADLRVFGGSADVRFPQCPACGGPPWTFDIDLRIPADMPPGVRTFPVWATDADGRRADTTASIEIVAR